MKLVTTTITGGRLESAGSGRFVIETGATLNDVASNAAIDVPSFIALTVEGSGLTNDGVITLNSDGGAFFSSLSFTEDTLLDGDGEVVLNTVSQPAALRFAPGALKSLVVTQGANHTIRGNGTLDVNLQNNGSIFGNSAAEPINVFQTLSGEGPLENVVISGSVFSGFGVHSPGDSTAIVPLDGLYEITSVGTLEIEIGGLTAGDEFDQLASVGTVQLGGTLDVSLIDLENGYTPNAGDRFIILESANPITGTFANTILPEIGLGRSLAWEPIDYSDPLKVVLEIADVDFLPADFDQDGDVDGDDLTIWQGAYGAGNGADADGDGLSNGKDFLIWQRQLGIGVPTVAAVSQVPEPCSGVIYVFGLLAFLFPSKRMTLRNDSTRP